MRSKPIIFIGVGIIISLSVIVYSSNPITSNSKYGKSTNDLQNINKEINLALNEKSACDVVQASPFAALEQCASPKRTPNSAIDLSLEIHSDEEEEKSHNAFITEILTKIRKNDVDAMRIYAQYAILCKQFSSKEGSHSSYCDLTDFTHINYIFLKSAATSAAAGNYEASLILAKWHLAELDSMYATSQTNATDDSAFFSSTAFKEKMTVLQTYMQSSNTSQTPESKILQYRLGLYKESESLHKNQNSDSISVHIKS